MKNIITWIIMGIVVVLGTILIYNSCTKEELDNIKFSKEYTLVGEDNVFIYKNVNDIIKILEEGTGIVYLGFPECKWCQAYVKYVNEVAKETGISEIFYFNILNDRKNNTKEYQKIVAILKDNLLLDENNNQRIFVPDISVIKNGKVLSHDNETSFIQGYNEPTDYWTNERIDALKSKLKNMFSEVSTVCTSCN